MTEPRRTDTGFVSGAIEAICAFTSPTHSAVMLKVDGMTDDLRALALAAQNDVAVLYSQGDARITVSTFTTFAQKAEFHNAASPDLILALLAEVDRLAAWGPDYEQGRSDGASDERARIAAEVGELDLIHGEGFAGSPWVSRAAVLALLEEDR